jgi:hypothetical protein
MVPLVKQEETEAQAPVVSAGMESTAALAGKTFLMGAMALPAHR